jgi:DNA-binding transcriptional MerR regulator
MPKARIQKRLYYKIGEACKALDIQPYVLRYWETEFPAISPGKSRSGQRVYSEKELEVIRRIKQLLYDEGYTIAGAKKKLEGELASGALGRPEEGPEDGQEETALPEPPAPPRERRAAAPPPVPVSRPDPETRPEPDSAPLQASLQLDARPAGELDTQGDERIQRLRSGVQRALAEARELLALLGPPADL